MTYTVGSVMTRMSAAASVLVTDRSFELERLTLYWCTEPHGEPSRVSGRVGQRAPGEPDALRRSARRAFGSPGVWLAGRLARRAFGSPLTPHSTSRSPGAWSRG